ncbi:MAG: winged helix-turn-helix domain-containing protein [Acidobacteria bacterium]|nr:winged helix-turn-helix domain-containing protein [Acidobacteriota bacterium]
MSAARQVKQILAENASQNFIGRSAELAVLELCLRPEGPLAVWVHGIAGIGKTALLTEFAKRAATAGAHIVLLDCRSIEPTAGSLLDALGDSLAPRGGRRTILLLDSYESFQLIDSWIRRSFIPELDHSVRIVIASRYPPSASWQLALEWQGLLHLLPVAAMPDADAIEILTRAGISRRDSQRINRLAGGYPLALRLAISSGSSRLRAHPEPESAQELIRQLAALYLNTVDDHDTRVALEAASVVYCVTRSLASAMLPGLAQAAYERLNASSFVQSTRNGLILQEPVRYALASSLLSSDPQRFQSYRRAAWRQLRTEAAAASREQMWAYTSGMLYLLQNRAVRDAFFPAITPTIEVERASADDGDAILGIAVQHETPASAAILHKWWTQAHSAFRVVRGASGISGFYVFVELRDKEIPRMEDDPLMREWRRHLRECPLPPGQTAVFLRRWLCAKAGEHPSPVQASCWLDVKRSYVELRPYLRRCYLAVCDVAPYAATAKTLGFQILDGYSATIDGVTHRMAVLDFGPGSVDAWLSGLVAAEIGVRVDGLLDLESRELVVGDKRTPLSTLEFDLLCYLQDRCGKAVARAELLQQVWGRRTASESNVVDVAVRAIRKKLGPRASMLTTVRGFGYMLQPSERNPQ